MIVIVIVGRAVVGYGGKSVERAAARELRAQGWTLDEIAVELGVAKSSVSRWVRDVAFEPGPRHRGIGVTRPHPHRLRALAEAERFARHGSERLGRLDRTAFLAAGTALYVGEGSKTTNEVALANADPDVVRFHLRWLRTFFEIDERKLRGSLHIHDDCDLIEAESFWSSVTEIPLEQFLKAYIVPARPGFRRRRHAHGVFTVRYFSASLQREVLGLCRGLLSSDSAIPG